jgi:hypothetical protein
MSAPSPNTQADAILQAAAAVRRAVAVLDAVTAKPNEIVLQVKDSEEFPTALPQRLVGLIDADEFTASIQRINDVKRQGPKYKISSCITVMLFLALFTFLGLFGGKVVSPAIYGGVTGGGICVVCVVMAMRDSATMRRWKAAYAQASEENARYNAPGRTPIQWLFRVEEVPIPGQYITDDDGYRRGPRTKNRLKLYITVPPQQEEQSQTSQPQSEQQQQSAQQPQSEQQPQPQSQPQLQPAPSQQQPQLLLQDIELVPYALPLQLFDAQPKPVGLGASAVFPSPPLHSVIDVYAAPPLQFPQPHVAAPPPSQPHQQSQGHYAAMSQPFSPHFVSSGSLSPPAGYGGAGVLHSQPSAPLQGGQEAGSCERCGHNAHSPQDCFCSACGGSIRRNF